MNDLLFAMNEDDKRFVRHKEEGWIGVVTVIFVSSATTFWASHQCGLKVEKVFSVTQDNQTPEGEYVEDPEINSLNELEIISEEEYLALKHKSDAD